MASARCLRHQSICPATSIRGVPFFIGLAVLGVGHWRWVHTKGRQEAKREPGQRGCRAKERKWREEESGRTMNKQSEAKKTAAQPNGMKQSAGKSKERKPKERKWNEESSGKTTLHNTAAHWSARGRLMYRFCVWPRAAPTQTKYTTQERNYRQKARMPREHNT
ncbi:uncharacterized protein BJ171DRAFT_106749 [Polychytrium aggregatum]|uniref:uncharacterized protein n=1 Tax=Polychytrium aggregatum TaxID=110093 RepID=UPI0022FDFEB5|nr:uncharacterized protein BJ171DRAFT_106749 [Polychytrium aggregatum]KAI9204430.1 hypothetical protein BJ171DRAFT_106749 [Polychytrium aggregatum]